MAAPVSQKASDGDLSIPPPQSYFKEMSYREFFQIFLEDPKKCDYIATDDASASKKNPIVSGEIGDCITIFGVQRDQEKEIISIVGYHVSDQTERETLHEELDAYFKDGEKKVVATDIFLIGGTQSSIDGGLLDAIREGLTGVLGYGNYKIVEERLNLAGKGYVTASLQMDGTLTFCRHKRS